MNGLKEALSAPVLLGSNNYDDGFQRLPTELLEEIFILSENWSLSHACRLFRIRFNNEPSRLRFSTRIFFLGNPENLESGIVASLLKKQANRLLAQDWFTHDFAKKVEAAVLEMKDEAVVNPEECDWNNLSDSSDDYTELRCPYTGGIVSKIGPNKVSTAKQVYLPARLLCEPWTRDKWALLRLLQRWGTSLNNADTDLCNEAINSAVLNDDKKLFKLLLIFRGEIDYEFFKLVKSFGTRKPVVETFLYDVSRHVTGHTWNDWTDGEAMHRVIMGNRKRDLKRQEPDGETWDYDDSAVDFHSYYLEAQLKHLLRDNKFRYRPESFPWLSYDDEDNEPRYVPLCKLTRPNSYWIERMRSIEACTGSFDGW